MRWYLNDASLQEQFFDQSAFEGVLKELLSVRAQSPAVKSNLRSTRSFPDGLIAPEVNVRQAVSAMQDRDLRSAVFNWLDKAGPFIDDDLLHEADDYFEYENKDVTTTGLGEAARRTKIAEACATYSFIGGPIDYARTPLHVIHGLKEKPYGTYDIINLWETDKLIEQANSTHDPIDSWSSLVETARQLFPHLEIAQLDSNKNLAREPFEASVRDRSMVLMRRLNDYVAGLNDDGSQTEQAREIVDNHFTGDRAHFSGESRTNQNNFEQEMTFQRSQGGNYFAHWHGKIHHRDFRLHFEWPFKKGQERLEVFYLGPKLTKS